MKIKASLTKFDKDFKVALSNKAKDVQKVCIILYTCSV